MINTFFLLKYFILHTYTELKYVKLLTVLSPVAELRTRYTAWVPYPEEIENVQNLNLLPNKDTNL